MSREAFEQKYGQSWADTPPHVRKLWLDAWQAATSAQEARVRELGRLLQIAGCPENCTEGAYAGHHGEAVQCQFCYEREKALSATAREDV